MKQAVKKAIFDGCCNFVSSLLLLPVFLVGLLPFHFSLFMNMYITGTLFNWIQGKMRGRLRDSIIFKRVHVIPRILVWCKSLDGKSMQEKGGESQTGKTRQRKWNKSNNEVSNTRNLRKKEVHSFILSFSIQDNSREWLRDLNVGWSSNSVLSPFLFMAVSQDRLTKTKGRTRAV